MEERDTPPPPPASVPASPPRTEWRQRRRLWLGRGSAVLLLAGAYLVCAPRDRAIRPLSIEVKSANDHQPLAGVRVHRVIETWEYEFPWIIHPNFEIHYRVDEYLTDAKGRTEIPSTSLWLGAHEYVQHEFVLVNLDIRPDAAADDWLVERYPDLKTEHGRLARLFEPHDWNHVEDFFNPLSSWRGFVAANVEWDWPSDAEQGGTVRRKFDVLWNSKSLLRDREVLSVELREPPPQSRPPSTP